jgi:myo-inositol-1(or 4)-monophosphatase
MSSNKHNLNTEEIFFKEIAPLLFEHVEKSLNMNTVSTLKSRDGDFATAIDISAEKLIVQKIQELFPEDKILAEEGFSETKIGQDRIWIIDPICGTNNLGRDIDLYCTNIALADRGELIASCVIDYNKKDFYWSVGGGRVYKNSDEFSAIQDEDMGVLIDVDLGCLPNVNRTNKSKYTHFLEKLLTETDYILCSHNTSLTFLNVAVGKVNGAVNMSNHPWDVCASVFLLSQMGGVISDIYGNQWYVGSDKGMVLSLNKKIHQKLLNTYALA